jgi:hypothetical protein
MYRTVLNRCLSTQNSFQVYFSNSILKLDRHHVVQVQHASTVNSTDEVKFDRVQRTGLIHLNKPKTLNALSLPMIRSIYPQMKVR